MHDKSIRLAEQRERLIALAAAQRVALARNIEPWRLPLARADQGLAALRFIRSHPSWIVGGISLLAALRPGRAVKWLLRGWGTWQLMHKLRDRMQASGESWQPVCRTPESIPIDRQR